MEEPETRDESQAAEAPHGMGEPQVMDEPQTDDAVHAADEPQAIGALQVVELGITMLSAPVVAFATTVGETANPVGRPCVLFSAALTFR